MDLAIAANQNDSLISQLSFQLPAVATYARERRLVQVMPQGANSFAPDGHQVLTFNLTSNQDGWLDPSSLRLHFRIRNRAAAGGNNGLLPRGDVTAFSPNYASLLAALKRSALSRTICYTSCSDAR